MHQRFVKPVLLALLLLAACDSMDRSRDAEEARRRMIGATKEQILACMGLPRHKAQEGATTVWSYASTNGRSSGGVSQRFGYTTFGSERQKSSCTVNVVMTNGIVSAVNYYGPRDGWMAPDEQCGYAVEHCVR